MQAIADSVNCWPDSACAKAFWSQQELPAYRQLLAATVAWLTPQRGERWLDLGCGCGQLTKALWVKGEGALAEIVGLDCAAINARAFRKLRADLRPPAPEHVIRFVAADFNAGLASFEADRFDGVVSGMAIQYAESYSEAAGRWTCDAYDAVLAEVYRVLRPGGSFVFSVNIPDPAWGQVAVHSFTSVFGTRQPIHFLKNAYRMWSYGAYLKREARRGRFHYLPVETVRQKLNEVGFVNVEHCISYARQAYLLRCGKPSCLQGG